MSHYCSKLARNGLIYIFHDRKIDREKDIEVTLLDLSYYKYKVCLFSNTNGSRTYIRCRHRYSPPLISGLHNRAPISWYPLRQLVKVAGDKLMLWEIFP